MFFRSSKTTPVKSSIREKVVALYDEIFFIPEEGKERVLINTDEFWEQLLLLKINTPELISRLNKLNNSDTGLLILKKCGEIIASSLSSKETVRCINGLITASITVRCLGYPSTLLRNCDTNAMTSAVSSLTNSSMDILGNEDSPHSMKKSAIGWVLCLLASDERLGDSSYTTSAFVNSSDSQQCSLKAVMSLLSNASTRFVFGKDAVSILSLLIQLPGSDNQFPGRFSILDDEASINSMSQIIDGELSNANVVWRDRLKQQQSRGMWSSLSSAFAGLLVGGDSQPPTTVLQPGLLLSFFYATILNRHFMPTLTQTYPIAAEPSPRNGSLSSPNDQDNTTDHVLPPSSSAEAGSVSDDNMTPRTPQIEQSSIDNFSPESHQLPGNLLLTVIEYTSAILQDTRDESRRHAAHVCLMALEAIVEDAYANSVLHDDNLAFRPVIHRVQLRHRRNQVQPSPPRPLANALFDLAIEFTCTHLMKSFPFELHYHALSIIHRLLCYEKKAGIRLKFDWHELWTALTALVRIFLFSYICQSH